MGKAGRKQAMKEIDETRAAGKDADFDAVIERIVNSGGTIEEDEDYPLYTEVGSQEFEVGYQRVIVFNINKNDFQLTRTVETHLLQGSGHQKHIEEMPSPRANFSLKSKSEMSNDWRVVDLEDIGGLF